MKIFAIGGGGIGRKGLPYEIKKFDEEIVRMAGVENPILLFVGFAQQKVEDAELYFGFINKNFGALGCKCENLREEYLNNSDLLKQKILNANIIYVAGGNTLRLMTILRKHKIDKMLEIAGGNGAVLCGSSAGAICWHAYGNSDSRKYTSNSEKLIKVTGLGFVPALFCPHYDVEISRQESLKNMMKTTKGVALAFDNCAALQIEGDEYRVWKAKETARAFKCFWSKGSYIKTELKNIGSIEDLVAKN